MNYQDSIDVIMPSRGRPDRCAEAASSLVATSTVKPSIYVAVDSDDKHIDEYKQIQDIDLVIIAPSAGAAIASNNVVQYSKSNFILWFADDFLMKSEGWNEILPKCFPNDMIAIVYPVIEERGGIKKLFFAPVFSRKWIDSVGWMFHPKIKHYWCDGVAFDMATLLNRAIYCNDVVIENRHWKRGDKNRIDHDATYELNERNAYSDEKVAKVTGRNEIYLAINILNQLIER